MAISVLIVDDHQLLVDALVTHLAGEPEFDVIGTAASLAEAGPLLSGHEPEVVLLDHRLPDADSARATHEILKELPTTRVLLMSAAEAYEILPAAMEAGIAGFVHKSRGADAVLQALRVVAEDGTAFESRDLQVAMSRMREPSDAGLTERELDVLGMLTEGMHADQIANQLVLSTHTVRNHIRHVLDKLDAHSQLEAVAVGLRRGLVSPPS